MNLAMTAAAGKVGTAILAAAQEKSLPIRALLRNAAPSSVPASSTVRFDFADRTSHARALEGVDTLILISPSTAQQVEQVSAVIDAARAAGVGHVVKLSGAGAEHGGTRFADQHRALEHHLNSSGIATTILRPTFFMENSLGIAGTIAAGIYPAPTADARMGQIAIADIAAVALAVVAEPGVHRGAVYTLTGPAAYTGEEMASAFSEAAGHPVRYVDVPETAFRQNLLDARLDVFTVEGLIEAYRLVRAGGAAATTDDVRRVTGRSPIDLATWTRSHAKAFLATGDASTDRALNPPERATR
ncbi:MAG: NAD(P)H-binding protein [Polyangiaceae bacterium]